MSETALQPPRPHIGWKIFYWFHVIIFIIWSMLTLIVLLAPDSVPISGDIKFSFTALKQDLLADSSLFEFLFNFVLLFFLTLGLYGYIYSKKIGTAKFWMLILIMDFINSSYDIFSFTSSDSEGLDLTSLIIISILIILFTFFELLALYRYSLKSPQIWDAAVKNETQS